MFDAEFWKEHGTTKSHISELAGVSTKVLSGEGRPNEETVKKMEAIKTVIEKFDIHWPLVPPAFKDRAAYEVAVNSRDKVDAFFVKEYNKVLNPEPEIPKGWDTVDTFAAKEVTTQDILDSIKSKRPSFSLRNFFRSFVK